MVTLVELQTVLFETEARVYNKPITYQTVNIDDPEPLTPSHLFHGRTMNVLTHSSSL